MVHGTHTAHVHQDQRGARPRHQHTSSKISSAMFSTQQHIFGTPRKTWLSTHHAIALHADRFLRLPAIVMTLLLAFIVITATIPHVSAASSSQSPGKRHDDPNIYLRRAVINTQSQRSAHHDILFSTDGDVHGFNPSDAVETDALHSSSTFKHRRLTTLQQMQAGDEAAETGVFFDTGEGIVSSSEHNAEVQPTERLRAGDQYSDERSRDWCSFGPSAQQYLVKVPAGVTRDSLNAALGDEGDVVAYMPASAFLVVTNPGGVARLFHKAMVIWIGRMDTTHKVSERLDHVFHDSASVSSPPGLLSDESMTSTVLPGDDDGSLSGAVDDADSGRTPAGHSHHQEAHRVSSVDGSKLAAQDHQYKNASASTITEVSLGDLLLSSNQLLNATATAARMQSTMKLAMAGMYIDGADDDLPRQAESDGGIGKRYDSTINGGGGDDDGDTQRSSRGADAEEVPFNMLFLDVMLPASDSLNISSIFKITFRRLSDAVKAADKGDDGRESKLKYVESFKLRDSTSSPGLASLRVRASPFGRNKILFRMKLKRPYNLLVSASSRAAAHSVVNALANAPYVQWIDVAPHRFMNNLKVNALIQSGRTPENQHPSSSSSSKNGAPNAEYFPLWKAGIRGQGQIVGMGDSGIDYKQCFFADSAESRPSERHRKVLAYRSIFGDDADAIGHGTHVAGTIAGSLEDGNYSTLVQAMREAEAASNGNVTNAYESNIFYEGVAPGAKIAFTDFSQGYTDGLMIPFWLTISRYYSWGYSKGARVHSDSWGSRSIRYDSDARDVDSFSWANMDFLPILAAGNFGTQASRYVTTVTSPATAKNGISVGATSISFSDDERARMADIASNTFEITFVTDAATAAADVENRGMHVGDDGQPSAEVSWAASALHGTNRFRLLQAGFGGSFAALMQEAAGAGFEVAFADPALSCMPLYNAASLRGKIAVAYRGDCEFVTKASYLQAAGALAVIIVNAEDALSPGFVLMGSSQGPRELNEITIPVGSVPASTGATLKATIPFQTLRVLIAGQTPIPTEASNQDYFENVPGYSSYGPTIDGRIKPDLVAPGETQSAAAYLPGNPSLLDGMRIVISFPFFSTGSNKRSGANKKRKMKLRDVPSSLASDKMKENSGGDDAPEQCSTTTSAGTSMAAPVVAGAALLVRQYFSDGYYPTCRDVASDGFDPSGPLVKAVLLNGAHSLEGFTADGVLPLENAPSNRQGFGRIDLKSSLPLQDSGYRIWITDMQYLAEGMGDNFCIHFEEPDSVHNLNVDGSEQRNASNTRTVRKPPSTESMPSSSSSVRITLVWHDPPSVPAADGPNLINDLDLKVLVNNGHVLETPVTRNDRINNVERLEIVPTVLPTVIQVWGESVPWPVVVSSGVVSGSDNVSNEKGEYDVVGQPYAMVISGPVGMIVSKVGDVRNNAGGVADDSSGNQQHPCDGYGSAIAAKANGEGNDNTGMGSTSKALDFCDCISASSAPDDDENPSASIIPPSDSDTAGIPPKGCAQHLLPLQLEFFCYVVNPSLCGGATASEAFPGAGWRLCIPG